MMLFTCLLPALVDRLYTWFLRPFIGHVGNGSVICFPTKLNNPKKIWIGEKVRVGAGTWLNAPSDDPGTITLRIKNGSHIGRNCHINAWKDVSIGEYAMIANNVHISDVTHTFSHLETPIILQPAIFAGAVEIKKGAWIGHGAVILPGTTIGINAVVGALSLVRRNVEDHQIVGGVPAEVLRTSKLRGSVA